jgi:hypothetical protein
MKVAFTHNLRLADVRETEKEAEYDSAETVNAIAAAIEAAGHEVEKVEVSGPASNLLERLETIDRTSSSTRRRATPADAIFSTCRVRGGHIRHTGSTRHERDHA